MLKKARLADSLNDHLIHRPGPLELVQKNILHAPDATIDQAIKGTIFDKLIKSLHFCVRLCLRPDLIHWRQPWRLHPN